jgi:hypothetical protein
MPMELLAAELTDEGTIRFTLAHAGGLTPLEGSVDEVDRLTAAMREVALLATASDTERCWLHELPVGERLVRLGLSPGGEVRMLVAPRADDR